MILKTLRSNQSFRHVGQLAAGTAIAQVAPILVTPILTRLYTPTQFGEFGIFAALLMGISIMVSGRYEIAIPLPSRDEDGFALFVISIIASFALSLLLFLAAILLLFYNSDRFSEALGTTSLALLLLPLGVLAASLMQSCGYWFTRLSKFSTVARARSTLGITTAALAVALGIAGEDNGLVLSLLGSYCLVTTVLLFVLAKGDGHRIKGLRPSTLRSMAREYKEFPLVNGPHSVLDALRESGSLIVFTSLFGPAATGFLSQTLRVLRAPMSLIGAAIGQVFFPKASRMRANGQSIKSMTTKTMLGVTAVSVPMYIVVLAFGPELFSIVFGPEWTVAGEYARILSPWLALVLIVSSVGTLPVIYSRQSTAFRINIAETIIRFAAILVGGRLSGARGALWGWAIGGLSVSVVQLLWYIGLGKMQTHHPLEPSTLLESHDPADEQEATMNTAGPLTVLVVSHLYPKGEGSSTGIFVKEQVEALSEIATVLLVVGRYAPRDGLKSTLRMGNLTVQEVRLPWLRFLPSALSVALAIPFYARAARRAAAESNLKFDIIHSHFGVPDGVVGARLSKLLSLPLVITLHGAAFNRQLTRPIVGRLFARRLSSANVIIGVSQLIASGMRSMLQLNESQAIHVANGYNSREITPHPSCTPDHFLFIGALIPRKNPDILIKAFASISQSTHLDLLLVGDGPMMSDLKLLASDLGVESRVAFEGHREHSLLDAYLREAATLVLPSSSEGMPIVVNESLASGTPVVATDLPGTAQQVRSDEFGRLVPVGDIDALATAMLEVGTKDWDYARISSDCDIPSWDEYAVTLESIYRRAITDSSNVAPGGRK